MKHKIKKISIILFIMLILSCLIFNTNISFASNEVVEEGPGVDDILGGILDGLVGIFLNILNIIPILIGGVFQFIATCIAKMDGGDFIFVTMEDILFNKVPILNVNFFSKLGNHNTIGEISRSIANWYYALRNIAIIISLAVLIYVGIRMVLSTIAEDKAKYKKMLTDWIVGFITIFLIHYIIVITVNVNDLLVQMFSGVPGNQTVFGNFAGRLAQNAVTPGVRYTEALASAYVYIFLQVMVFMFLFNYIKRMLTIAFLIIISPIITVTYSIDKMGDGKSQALNTWLKEFVYNIIIQPFHCIIYLAFMTIVMNIIGADELSWFSGGGIGAGVFAIVVMFFIKQAEPIVRRIFGFDNASSLGSALASGALLMSSMNAAQKVVGSKIGNKEGGSSDKKSNNKKSSKPTTSNNANRNVNNINDANKKNEGKNSQKSQDTKTSENKKDQNKEKSNASSRETKETSSRDKNNSSNNSSRENQRNSRGADSEDTDSSLNTKPIKTTSQKVKDGLKTFAKTYASASVKATSMAIGAYATDDPITGAMTGYNYGKVLQEGAVGAGKKIGSFVTKRPRMIKKRNQLIDDYNKVKSDMGWNDNIMYNQSERLMQIQNTERISNPTLRKYAETLQDYRKEFEDKYQEPTDMVLDTINKVQTGKVTKVEGPKRFTRKK